MGKLKKISVLFPLLLLAVAPGGQCRAAEQAMRGVWISTVANLDYPSAQNLSRQQLAGQIDQILDTMEQANLNCAFFQVRPCADSFYPSKIFPYSLYFTGQQGRSPDQKFDPLAYLVEQAHARLLEQEQLEIGWSE